MAFSYSFHLSAKGHSVNTIGKINQVSRHNLRAYKSENFDHNLIEIVSGSASSILDDVKQVYHEEFDDVLQKYNEGKREDRKIKDYLEHMSNSRGDVATEIIIQVGDKDFWENKNLQEKKLMTPVFKKQLLKLQELVPELKIASAVIHYDENSPHMHIVGIPVADGYKKGMERQVAKTKIFTAERLSYLQDSMRTYAEAEMNKVPELFSNMQLKEKEKGRNKDLPKSALNEYYETIKREAEALDKLKEDTKEKIDAINVPIPEYKVKENDGNALNSLANLLEARLKESKPEDKEIVIKLPKNIVNKCVEAIRNAMTLFGFMKKEHKAQIEEKVAPIKEEAKISIKDMLVKNKAMVEERDRQKAGQKLDLKHKTDQNIE